MKKLAICFNTHIWDKLTQNLFHSIYDQIKDRNDIDMWVLVNATENKKIAKQVKVECNKFVFDLNDYRYEKWWFDDMYISNANWKKDNYLAGFFDFTIKHQEYDYYMWMENDVLYMGDWNSIFNFQWMAEHDVIVDMALHKISTTAPNRWHYALAGLRYMDIPKEQHCHALLNMFIIKREKMNETVDRINSMDEVNGFGEIMLPTIWNYLKYKIGFVYNRTKAHIFVVPPKIVEKLAAERNYDMDGWIIHPIKKLDLYDKIISASSKNKK